MASNVDDLFVGLDLEWLAADADGHLAVLTVVDGRPMPESFRDTAVLDQTWDFIRALPVRCEAELLVKLPRPDDYIMFAERGLFAYDWTTEKARHCYELRARPRTPIQLREIEVPAIVRNAIWNGSSLKFSESIDFTPPKAGFRH